MTIGLKRGISGMTIYEVKQVNVRVVGKDRVLSPVDSAWDSFFFSEERVSDDFLEERASQEQAEREAF